MIHGSPVYHASLREKGLHNFEGAMLELKQAIQSCEDGGLYMPSLMLLYSGIDIMANLDRPDSAKEAGRAGYIGWVNEYLLKGSDLACTGEEIYAARCGLLHSMVLKSSNQRSASARKIIYLHINDRKMASRLMPVLDPPDCVWVRTDALIGAFKSSLERFRLRVQVDPLKGDLVYERALSIPIFLNLLMPFHPEVTTEHSNAKA